ncbi:hypothetical protein EV361DRAFT_910723 [Lentinula raphanica]|nr:hypothetical protein EV361DRAFT_910723 [Lentinula raphanica]
MVSTLSDDDHSKVATLNSEGNTLFKNADYVAAAAKYTAALDIDQKNAILFSNRAACWLSLNLYLDALSDATKATELDSSFVKALGRLARALDALGRPFQSALSWEQALNRLPRKSLRLPERTQLYEYKKGLAAAKHEQLRQQKALQMSVKQNMVRKSEDKGLPWMIAKGLIPLLVARGDYTSCAWTLNKAYDDLCEGMRHLASTADRSTQAASPRVLELFSSSVLLDYRAWHFRNSDYLQQFDRKAIQETKFYGAFAPKYGLEGIKRIVNARLESAKPEGEVKYKKEWEALQLSLTATVRYWIMEGFHQGTLYQNPAVGADYLDQAIALIKWVRLQIHGDDLLNVVNGTIFEETYLKGVQALRLHFLIEKFHDLDPRTQQAMYEEAEGIANETISFQTLRNSDTVFTASTWYTARGYALTIKALYYQTRGLYAFAGLSYKLSAECFAEDDGKYIVALLRCIKSTEYIRSPSVDIQNEALEKIRKAIPKLKYVWKARKEVDDIDKTITEALQWEETLKGRLKTNYYDQFY